MNQMQSVKKTHQEERRASDEIQAAFRALRENPKAWYNHLSDRFRRIVSENPLSWAAVENPGFGVLPPTFSLPLEWSRQLRSFPLPKPVKNRLLARGFCSMDMSVLAIVDQFESVRNLLRKNNIEGDYFPLDYDYGQMLLPIQHRTTGQYGAYSFDVKMAQRYGLERIPTAVYNIGAQRGHRFCDCVAEDNQVPHIHVKSKQELMTVIHASQKKVACAPNLEIWFRGQNRDYLLEDLTEDAKALRCPWREYTDTALLPSLFRRMKAMQQDMEGYLQLLYEVQQYCAFVSSFAGAPYFLLTDPFGEAHDMLSHPKWGASAFSMTSSMQGQFLQALDFQPEFFGLQRSFFLQHYGLPSNVIDITTDVDVALFFAQMAFATDGTCKPTLFDDLQKPVLYVFFLDRERDPFLDSRALCLKHNLLRPLRQKCGLLAGASTFVQNFCSRFLSLKIFLDGPVYYGSLSPEYIFPGEDEDPFLKTLLRCSENAVLDMRFKPFVLGTGCH